MPDLRVVASVVDAGTPSARLVAWMTGAQLPDHADATAAVAQVLPAHMRPILVMVDGFPRTAGGKIDKAALPVPEVAVHPAPVLDGDDACPRPICHYGKSARQPRRRGRPELLRSGGAFPFDD